MHRILPGLLDRLGAALQSSNRKEEAIGLARQIERLANLAEESDKAKAMAPLIRELTQGTSVRKGIEDYVDITRVALQQPHQQGQPWPEFDRAVERLADRTSVFA